MRRMLILVSAFALAACSGSSGSDTSTGSTGTTSNSSGGGTSGNGTTGSVSCTDAVTSPFNASEGCILSGQTGDSISKSEGGIDAGATIIIVGDRDFSFNGQLVDANFANKTYTQADARQWNLTVSEPVDGGVTIEYLRRTTDTFGTFALDITSNSADEFGTLDLHGTLSASFNAPLDDGGSAAVAVTASF
jgi:hypothetical protein